jgi:hypothetical protein
MQLRALIRTARDIFAERKFQEKFFRRAALLSAQTNDFPSRMICPRVTPSKNKFRVSAGRHTNLIHLLNDTFLPQL